MERVYRFKKYIIAINIVISLACAFPLFYVFKEASFSEHAFMILMVIGFSIVWWLMLASSIMKKLTIGPEKITIRGLSGIKEVNWKDIAFFERFSEEQSSGISLRSESKSELLQISSYFEKQGEIEYLLTQYITDLDRKVYEESLEEVLSNESLGRDLEERKEKLIHTKLIAKVLTIVSVITCICLIFLSGLYYELIVSVSLLVFIANLVALYLFRGTVTVIADKHDAKGGLIGVFFLSICFMLRGMLDIDILEYNTQFWVGAIGLALALSLYISLNEISKAKLFHKVLDFASVFLLLLPFSCGSITISNTLLDESEGKVHHVEVIGKKENDSSYNLEVKSINGEIAEHKVDVSGELYRNTEIGGEVILFIRDGYWGIPYYFIFEEE